MSLLVLIQLQTKPNAEAAFLRAARALKAATASEPGTLRYDWFATPEPGRYAVVEEYADADAAEAHNHHVAALLQELFAAVDLVSASFFGELNAYIRDWASGRPGITVHAPLLA